jgi:hypothetical protein
VGALRAPAFTQLRNERQTMPRDRLGSGKHRRGPNHHGVAESRPVAAKYRGANLNDAIRHHGEYMIHIWQNYTASIHYSSAKAY